MKFTNNHLIKFSLLLSIIFMTACENEELKGEAITTKNNNNLELTAKFNNQKIINKKGENYIYKNGNLSQITVYENIDSITTDLTKNNNTVSFKSLYSNNSFKLQKINQINDKELTFDLYLNGTLFEQNIKLSSNVPFSEIQGKTNAKCGWLCQGIVAGIVKEIVDASSDWVKEETCSDAIDACENNGGLPQLTRKDNGDCEVRCEPNPN